MVSGRNVLLLPALLVVVSTASLQAGGRRDAKKPAITVAECEQLVAQLVNPNKPPFLPQPHDPDYRLKGYDFGTQRKMKEAFDSLSDNIEVALPVLMKHVKDQRFSYVYEVPSGGYVRISVGGACYHIVERHVDVPQQGFKGQRPFLFFIRDGGGGRERWWKSREGKPLAELQLAPNEFPGCNG